MKYYVERSFAASQPPQINTGVSTAVLSGTGEATGSSITQEGHSESPPTAAHFLLASPNPSYLFQESVSPLPRPRRVITTLDRRAPSMSSISSRLLLVSTLPYQPSSLHLPLPLLPQAQRRFERPARLQAAFATDAWVDV
ncbi:hypothetical protein I350_03133 [Cryptococcus amylolentus CBS 6273]|uniref:Uncharacterized protein n=1 Tax=Cryptococcus amylolentus CBS 6273 TaxID=1296118 RepID=A0A1E3K8S0_9TREE|nr:hypothetical protein I350_03133 [Cryptococcus amylolentus CBS 6273]